MNNKKIKKGKCYFCGKPFNDDLYYCYGCQEFVCDECDERGGIIDFGSHSVEEHREK